MLSQPALCSAASTPCSCSYCAILLSVPWFIWMDPAFAKAYGINETCLKQKAANGSFSHDNLFHTLIDFASVKTSALNEKMSLLSGCHTH